MKSDKIRQAIGGIDDDLIEAAESRNTSKKGSRSWVKWASAAAVFVLILTLAGVSGLFRKEPPVSPGSSEAVPTESEAVLEEKYIYSVDAGQYASYIGGKVIAENLLGKKLEDVNVTAGWFNAQGTRLTEEHTKAEIYEISGVSTDVAVAIRFLEKLEAATTDHYYVILNPQADLTSVQAYVIPVETQGEGPVPE